MVEQLWSSIITFWHSEHFWDGITALSTAAAAIFTAVMARLTFRAIREGQGQRLDANQHFAETRRQDEQHHEDSYRPLLALVPLYDISGVRQGELMKTTSRDGGYVLTVFCGIRNLGPGPALNVRVTVRASDLAGNVASRELSAMKAGDRGPERRYFEIPVILTDSFNTNDLASTPSGLWTLLLDYEDIFGNAFHTVHSKSAAEPWTRVGKGPSPQPPKISVPIFEPASGDSREAFL